VADILQLIELKIRLPTNRDYLGALSVLNSSGVVLAGPFRIAGRASDEIAAEHGNPTRATTLPYGDPPLGSYRFQGMAGTGEGTRFRQDLFGSLDVIILNGTGGHAALADANGRFEIVVHGGPFATNGGLRASTGHFRISDPDLAALCDLIRRAEAVSCVCEEVPTDVGVDAVSDLQVPADRSTERRPTRQRKPRSSFAHEYLVAFGEYSSPDPIVDTSLNSPALPPPGQQGSACMGMECQNMQSVAAQSQDVNPYTGGRYAVTPLIADPFSGGPSPFFPNGQPINVYNGSYVSNAPRRQSGQSNTGDQGYNAISALNAPPNAGTRGIYVPNAVGADPYNSGPSPYLPVGKSTRQPTTFVREHPESVILTEPTGAQGAPSVSIPDKPQDAMSQRLKDYGLLSDDAIIARAKAEIAVNQLKADSGKPPAQVIADECKPLQLTPAAKQKRGPAVRAPLPPSEFDYVRIESEGNPAIFVSPDTAEWLQSLKDKGNAQAVWFGVGGSFVALGAARAANQTAGEAVSDGRLTVGKAPIDNAPPRSPEQPLAGPAPPSAVKPPAPPLSPAATGSAALPRMSDRAIAQHHMFNVNAENVLIETPFLRGAWRLKLGKLNESSLVGSLEMNPETRNMYLGIDQPVGVSVPDLLHTGGGTGRPFLEVTSMNPATVEAHRGRWYWEYSDPILYPNAPPRWNIWRAPGGQRLRAWQDR
jgi:hypothetical protein